MNFCRRCESEYEKPGTCNCYAEKAAPVAVPLQTPVYPYVVPWWVHQPYPTYPYGPFWVGDPYPGTTWVGGGVTISGRDATGSGGLIVTYTDTAGSVKTYVQPQADGVHVYAETPAGGCEA